MRKTIAVLALVACLAIVGQARAQEELRLYNWSEYMDPAILEQFEEQFGVKVRVDLYESNEEMMAKLQAGGVSQYDVIVPSEYFLPSLIQLGLIRKLDHSRIPNLDNLGHKFQQADYDPGNEYSAAYLWGTVGLMYRKDKVTRDQAMSWDVIFDPAASPGSFLLIDSVREMLGITFCYQGHDFNTTNVDHIRQATSLLIDTKKRSDCLGFEGGVGGKNKVVAGVANAAIVYNGDALRSIAEDPENLGFVVPREGSEIWVDNMCIPAKAPNPDAAHAFINYILDPEIGAQLANWNQYATPNQAARPLIAEEDLNNPAIYPPDEVMDVLHFSMDLGKKTRLYDEAWTMVKSR
jgi:spermidine/putrescine transport system substrate-binding protein